MIASLIRLIVTNIPLFMFILALIIPLIKKRKYSNSAESYLSWLLLLSIGVTSLWAGLYNTIWPATAAEFIGWQSSPFQFEMGMSDIALGIVAIVSFWRSLEFKSAVVMWVSIEFAGLIYGHFHQLSTTGDHHAGNAGILLGLTIVHVILLPLLLISAYKKWRKEP